MSDRSPDSVNVIETTQELLAYSLALEKEAVERFTDLAEQMEVHNNPEVAELFHKLAAIEGKHVDNVKRVAQGQQLPEMFAWEFDWHGQGQSPEGGSMADAHYLMQPWHAIDLALKGEQRAVDFFRRVAETAKDEAVAQLARTLLAEEEEHVRLLQQWQQRYPRPARGWDEDPDPPMLQE